MPARNTKVSSRSPYEPLNHDEYSGQGEEFNPTCCLKWCCGITCGCSCCLLFVVLLSVWAVFPGLISAYSGKLLCGSDVECKADATVKLDNLPMGSHGVPFGYFTVAMGAEPELFHQHEVESWKGVKDDLKQVPQKTWDGQWWRGNELGFIVNNPAFWMQSGIEPPTILLGARMKQHAAVRPFLMEMFASEDTAVLREFAKTFLAERAEAGEVKVPEDFVRFTHQLLYRASFGEKPHWDTTGLFYKAQQSVLKMGTVSQALPSWLWWVLGIDDIQHEVYPFYRDYMVMLEDRFGDELTSIAHSECAPSPNCSIQLASGTWDALYAAGGNSVPGVMQTGVAMMYSTDSSNPTHKEYRVPKGKETEFTYEVMRYVPPVYGFPFWTTRPTCEGLTDEETLSLNLTQGNMKACPIQPEDWAGYPPENQWEGGMRTVLNLAATGWDQSVWGDDANTFVIRNLAEYKDKFMGFADFAEDENVTDGKNNRSCPGKQLALDICTAFFEVFDPDDWTIDNSGIKIDPFGALSQVGPYVLKPKAAS